MERSDPTAAVVNLLTEHILPQGTIIAWNKSFEMDVHRRLARRVTAHSPTIDRMNSMFYGLKDAFPFHNTITCIRNLRAASPSSMCCRRSCRIYNTRSSAFTGSAGSDAWWTMVSSTNSAEREMIAKDLKEYCGLDTYAMYAIWKHLHGIGQWRMARRVPLLKGSHRTRNVECVTDEGGRGRRQSEIAAMRALSRVDPIPLPKSILPVEGQVHNLFSKLEICPGTLHWLRRLKKIRISLCGASNALSI